jgi:prepilin-type processing-associated H-X9-DG protein
MNLYMGLPYASRKGEYWRFQRLVELPSPATLFVFIDEHEDSITGGDFLMSLGLDATIWNDHPASRHNSSGVLSFADGHVELKKWLDARTRQPVTRSRLLGVAAPGSVDLRWLAERTSVIK